MNNTVKRSALLSSVITVALCLSLITGATFALFTDTTTVNIAVTAANVDVTAAIAEDSIQTLSIGDSSVRTDGSFENGGQAQIDGANLKLSLMTPGDIAKFTIEVTNSSNIKIKYKVCMVSNPVEKSEGGYYTDLTEALNINAIINGIPYEITGDENSTDWIDVASGADIGDIEVTVEFPSTDTDGSNDNKYKDARADITFVVKAIQYNAQTP